MGKMQLIQALFALAQQGDRDVCEDLFNLIREKEIEGATVGVDGIGKSTHYDPENHKLAHQYSKELRKICAQNIKSYGDGMFLELYRKTLLFDAPSDFDAFCRYIELEREPAKRFYEPRRKQLLPAVQALQDLADDKLDLLAISEPPGIGKTTLAIFYLCWIAGRNPELTILGGSHSNSFLRGVFEEILRIVGNDSEYLYKDVFPEAPVVKTNSKDLRIDLQKTKRFETFEFSSIGSGNAGKVRASNLLYCDDLVEGIEAAMNRDRMDKLWQQYYTDLRQRKIGNAKELHIATRWSVVDPIGRLEAQYADNPRAKFIRFSALDENDESNFDYPYGVGFTTEFYREQREIMDDASWRALYCNEPIEREGLLYAEDELRRYFELPEGEPDAIIAVCDTKSTGTDYCVMPIVYKYGRDLYIEDVLCENYSLEVIEPKLAQLLTKHKVQLAQFESNAAGGKVAEKVQGLVREQGGICKITTKWTQSNKDTKIIVNAPFVKERCLFKDNSIIKSHEDLEYRTMLKFLCGYTMAGKNKHDDVPDAFAQLALYLQNFGGNTVTIGRRIF